MGVSAGENVAANSPRTLVISFPRSGLNWLRHCAEYFSGRRTPGRVHFVSEGPTIFDRAHDVTKPNKRDYVSLYALDGSEIYQKVALLLRDPCDCFISHYLTRSEFSFKKALAAFGAFATNIVEFDRLQHAEKTVFYFEDFASQEAGTFAFLRFLGVDPAARPYDFKKLIESSRVWYRNMHGTTVDKRRHALKSAQRVAIWNMLRTRLGSKFQQYLGRYCESCVSN
jgi:hypothetical protein